MDKIMTLHPEGKAGVNIDRNKYDSIKSSILENIRKDGSISFSELTRRVSDDLTGKFDGKAPWYVVTVKLDLEARGEIERIPGKSPQILRLIKK